MLTMLAAGKLIGSKSLLGDGAALDLASMELVLPFQRVLWQCSSLAMAGICRDLVEHALGSCSAMF
jgi:hypothetical protein